MKKSVFLMVLCVLLRCESRLSNQTKLYAQKSEAFPHRLWVYWQKDVELAPPFTHLCLNNMRHFTNISNWELILMNDSTVYDYLTEESKQKFNVLLGKLPQLSVQGKSDLIRLFVLHDNGGMWLDATSFFLTNFSWVQKIDQEKGVYNKIAPNPEMVMFTYNSMFGGNKTVVFDEDRQQDVMLFPGTQYWSFLAKPKAKLLADLIDQMMYTFQKATLQEYFQENDKLGYQYQNERTPYFIYSIYQIQTVLQKKQKEIQTHPQKFKQKYAVEYYQVWNIDALSNTYLLFEVNQWNENDPMRTIFYESIDGLFDLSNQTLHFIKFNGPFSRDTNFILRQALNLICQDFMEPFPKNSIMSEYLFKYSEHLEIAQNYRKIESQIRNNHEMQCESLIPESVSSAINETLVWTSLAITLYIISGFFVIKLISKSLRKSQGFTQNESI